MFKALLKKKTFSFGRVAIALLIFVAGVLFNRVHLEAAIPSDDTPQENIDLFWRVWNILEDRYPFDSPLADEKIHGAISGLAESYGDDYTSFLPPRQAQFLNDTVSGKFGGIGAEVNISGGLLVIVAPLEGSPSQKAGLKAGDIVLSVDDVDVVGMTLDQAISYIRGEKGTPVTLTIVREGSEETQEIIVVRDIVSIPISDTEIIDDVFVIHLYNFNEFSQKEFRGVIQEFKDSKKDKLLLDLRNNPGGYLDAAVDISSYFLPQGKVVVSEDFGGSDREAEIYRSSGHSELQDLDYDLAILVNKGSASASEIVAAALSEHGKATVLGKTTYGKGSVQELISLPGDTSLKVTVAKWLTPKGKHIDKLGIEPEIIIEEEEGEEEDDLQLLGALDFLRTGSIIK